MTEPHRIRLRGPWEVEAIAADRTLHVRPFGKPTKLDPNERVWLVIDGTVGIGEARLNEQPLGSIGSGSPCEWDITGQLLARNRLEIERVGEGAVGDVRLEIRTSC